MLDHLIPKDHGGLDTGDNLVPACGTCNGSKGAQGRPALVTRPGRFSSSLIMRRYLKIVAKECEAAEIIDARVDSDEVRRLPFVAEEVPTSRFPLPSLLRLK